MIHVYLVETQLRNIVITGESSHSESINREFILITHYFGWALCLIAVRALDPLQVHLPSFEFPPGEFNSKSKTLILCY